MEKYPFFFKYTFECHGSTIRISRKNEIQKSNIQNAHIHIKLSELDEGKKKGEIEIEDLRCRKSGDLSANP